jgi:hypothetical protein
MLSLVIVTLPYHANQKQDLSSFSLTRFSRILWGDFFILVILDNKQRLRPME